MSCVGSLPFHSLFFTQSRRGRQSAVSRVGERGEEARKWEKRGGGKSKKGTRSGSDLLFFLGRKIAFFSLSLCALLVGPLRASRPELHQLDVILTFGRSTTRREERKQALKRLQSASPSFNTRREKKGNDGKRAEGAATSERERRSEREVGTGPLLEKKRRKKNQPRAFCAAAAAHRERQASIIARSQRAAGRQRERFRFSQLSRGGASKSPKEVEVEVERSKGLGRALLLFFLLTASPELLDEAFPSPFRGRRRGEEVAPHLSRGLARSLFSLLKTLLHFSLFLSSSSQKKKNVIAGFSLLSLSFYPSPSQPWGTVFPVARAPRRASPHR